jgi:hypothetical protein
VDIVLVDGGKNIQFKGFGKRPNLGVTVLNPEDPKDFWNTIGWQQTIGDRRIFWTSKVPAENPALVHPGDFGGIFRQKYIFKELPQESSRPYLHETTPDSVYTDGTHYYGWRPNGVKLGSKQNEIYVPDTDEPQYFTWAFGAPERGETNRSYVLIADAEKRRWKGYYESYKGFPIEISGRMTGILSAKLESILMGELAFNFWPQNILGWNNNLLSRQRWGLSAKFFQSLVSFSLGKSTSDTANTKVSLQVQTLDLKYRFSPGVWGRDETWGAIGGYQNVNFSNIISRQAGVGAFWARSMPRVFDTLFNYLPLMGYPKFVDMEFMYYMSSLSPEVTLQQNWSLNFHGKVFWSDRLFGEAGFGTKSYAYSDRLQNKKAAFTAAYGTIGMGLNF